jgi:hypothetical protein
LGSGGAVLSGFCVMSISISMPGDARPRDSKSCRGDLEFIVFWFVDNVAYARDLLTMSIMCERRLF